MGDSLPQVLQRRSKEAGFIEALALATNQEAILTCLPPIPASEYVVPLIFLVRKKAPPQRGLALEA